MNKLDSMDHKLFCKIEREIYLETFRLVYGINCHEILLSLSRGT